MKRRGLNFITEHHEELLDQSTITVCEQQLDNVAPKIVGLLSLGPTVDLTTVRNNLVKHCLLYSESLKSQKSRKDEDQLMEDEEAFGTKFNAYLCPNPGSSANMAARK